MKPGEAEHRFGEYFEIERVAGDEKPDFSRYPPATATYLMTRKTEKIEVTI